MCHDYVGIKVSVVLCRVASRVSKSRPLADFGKSHHEQYYVGHTAELVFTL